MFFITRETNKRLVYCLTQEEKRFVLYEYLLFFWKKKLWFVIITIAVMALAAIASQLIIKKSAYEGHAVIFTGSIKSKALTDPQSIEATYGQKMKNSLDVYVSSDAYIKIKVSGNNQQSVTNDLNMITGGISKALDADYKSRYTVTKDYVDALNSRIDDLTKQNVIYREKIADNTLSPGLRKSYTDLAQTSETALSDAMSTRQRVTNDLVLFEKPALQSSSIGQGKSYLKESIAIGFVLGILASFVLLILWKYIFEARRYYRD